MDLTSSRGFTVWTVVAGVLLVAPVLLNLAPGVPRVWAPAPVILVVPLWVMGGMAVVLPSLGFWATGIGLFKGQDRIPLWFAILVGIVGALNLASLVVSWEYGVRWQGRGYTIAVSAVTIAGYAIVVLIIGLARNRQSFRLNLLGRWCFFLWLAWLSFPYLGELP